MITTVQSGVKIAIQQHEQVVQKKQEEQASFTPYWKFPIFDYDDDEYTIQHKEYLENSSNAITPDLSTEEPDNSLSKLAPINPIPLGIHEADFDPEGDIRLIEQLLYDDYASSDDNPLYSEDIDYVDRF
ncbi:hypothetical protein Tco_0439803 [Tanacetum coccineum]